MSMVCCDRCSQCVDSDLHCEVFREGYRTVLLEGKIGLLKTDNENDVVALCDECAEILGVVGEYE